MGVILKNTKVLFLVVLLAGGYYIWNNPSSVPYPPLSSKITELKKEGLSTEDVKELNINTPGIILGIKDQIVSFSKNTTIPSNISGLPEEVVVEDIVNQMTEEVKKLPEKQAKKIKTQFCQDVINEATSSANR